MDSPAATHCMQGGRGPGGRGRGPGMQSGFGPQGMPPQMQMQVPHPMMAPMPMQAAAMGGPMGPGRGHPAALGRGGRGRAGRNDRGGPVLGGRGPPRGAAGRGPQVGSPPRAVLLADLAYSKNVSC